MASMACCATALVIIAWDIACAWARSVLFFPADLPTAPLALARPASPAAATTLELPLAPAPARPLVARAARFFGESRPSGGRGALGRGCPSENEKRRGVVGCGVRPPAPGSAAGTLLSTADSAGSLCCSIYRAVKEAHEMGWAN